MEQEEGPEPLCLAGVSKLPTVFSVRVGGDQELLVWSRVLNAVRLLSSTHAHPRR